MTPNKIFFWSNQSPLTNTLLTDSEKKNLESQIEKKNYSDTKNYYFSQIYNPNNSKNIMVNIKLYLDLIEQHEGVHSLEYHQELEKILKNKKNILSNFAENEQFLHLELWIKFINLSQDQLEIFEHLQDIKLFSNIPRFYIEKSELLKTKLQYRDSLQILQHGVTQCGDKKYILQIYIQELEDFFQKQIKILQKQEKQFNKQQDNYTIDEASKPVTGPIKRSIPIRKSNLVSNKYPEQIQFNNFQIYVDEDRRQSYFGVGYILAVQCEQIIKKLQIQNNQPENKPVSWITKEKKYLIQAVNGSIPSLNFKLSQKKNEDEDISDFFSKKNLIISQISPQKNKNIGVGLSLSNKNSESKIKYQNDVDKSIENNTLADTSNNDLNNAQIQYNESIISQHKYTQYLGKLHYAPIQKLRQNQNDSLFEFDDQMIFFINSDSKDIQNLENDYEYSQKENLNKANIISRKQERVALGELPIEEFLVDILKDLESDLDDSFIEKGSTKNGFQGFYSQTDAFQLTPISEINSLDISENYKK